MMLAASMPRHSYARNMPDFGSPSPILDMMDSGNYVNLDDSGPIDILSASTFAEAMQGRPSEGSLPQQYYGGIVSDHSSRHETPEPRKRTRRTPQSLHGASSRANKPLNDAQSKKTRGRPRLDPKDATAADRRRTQIRLAQRAYRYRKESTIAELKTRVSELETVIEQMNKTFFELHDNLYDTAVVSSSASTIAVANRLAAASDEFKRLIKSAAIEDDIGSEDEKMERLKDRHPASSSDAGSGSDDHNIVGVAGYLYSRDAMDLSQPKHLQFNTDGPLSPAHVSILEHSLINAAEQGRSLEPIPMPVTSPVQYTYSFQETTFARRLLRQCLEKAFRYLSNPAIAPDVVARAFRFSFTFSNKRRMLARFQELLRRKAGESLENWNVPFFLIGGAGTHFPRRDENGEPIMPPNMISPARALGPYVLPTAETPRTEATIEKLLDALDLGGDWYDSHDVEQYLRSRGIPVEAQSSFITFDAALLLEEHTDLAPTRNFGLTSGLTRSLAPNTPSEAQQSTIDFTFGQSNLLSRFADQGYVWDAREDGPFFDTQDYSAGSTTATTPTRLLTLDVEKFLSAVVDKSVCLGRAPGFRKADVDAALLASVQEGF